jgi:hypothetical protein
MDWIQKAEVRGPTVCHCEYGNESPGTVKMAGFLE